MLEVEYRLPVCVGVNSNIPLGNAEVGLACFVKLDPLDDIVGDPPFLGNEGSVRCRTAKLPPGSGNIGFGDKSSMIHSFSHRCICLYLSPCSEKPILNSVVLGGRFGLSTE
jgi:hypothetical protein